jgi:hypothetical protein
MIACCMWRSRLFQVNRLSVIAEKIVEREVIIAGAGNGLFVVRDVVESEIIDYSADIRVQKGLLLNTQLNNYAFSSELQKYAEVLFGSGMMINHNSEPNVEVKCANYSVNSDCLLMSLVARGPIPAGSELFLSYGDASWFTDRKIAVSTIDVKNAKRSVAELQREGRCVSNTAFWKSVGSDYIYPIALQDFKKGSVIQISPVIMLPSSRFRFTNLSRLMFNTTDPEVVLLPFNSGALFEYDPNGHNADICWHHTEDSGIVDCFKMPDIFAEGTVTKRRLMRTTGASTDLNFEYRANRDILKGEKITIKYGMPAKSAITLNGNGAIEDSEPSPLKTFPFKDFDNRYFSPEFSADPFKDLYREEVMQEMLGLNKDALVDVLLKRAKKMGLK